MLAVFERELKSYFASPIGYVYIAVFYVFSGLYFTNMTLRSNTTDLSYVFSGMFSICLFSIPILTMRLMSEERRNKTDQALLTAPVSLLGLTMGKYLAAVMVFVIAMLMTLVYAVVVAFFAPPDWAVIFGHFIGMLLLGAALIAIGLFISSLTENQVIAAVGGFAVSFILMLLDGVSANLQNNVLRKIVSSLSFNGHYQKFTQGMLDFADVIFFLSVCFVFIFFTIRVFERRRWR